MRPTPKHSCDQEDYKSYLPPNIAEFRARFRFGFCSIFLVALLLSGCQTPSWIPWLGEEEEITPIVELKLVGWDDGAIANQRLQALVDRYNETMPSVHVTLELLAEYETALLTALESDTPPDLFLTDSFRLPDFVKSNAIDPLDAHLTRFRDPIRIDDFYPALLNAFSIDGTLQCLPRDGSTLALFYNKALFDEAEIAIPSAEWGWDDLESAMQKIAETTNPFYTTYGMATSLDFSRWAPFLFQAGGAVITTDVATGGTQMSINSAAAKSALDFYLTPLLDGIAATPAELKSSWGGETLGKGRVGMTIEGNWAVPYLASEFPELEYGIAPLPKGVAGRATLLFSSCYAVSKRAQHADEAFAFATYLTSGASMQSWTTDRPLLPARRSVNEMWLAQNPQMAPFVTGLDHARPWRFAAGFQEVVDVVNSGMQQVIDAEIDTEELLRVAEVIGNEVLAR